MLYVNLLNYVSSKRIGTLTWSINVIEVLKIRNNSVLFLVTEESRLKKLLINLGVKDNQIIVLPIRNNFFKHLSIQYYLYKLTNLNDYIFTPYVGGLFFNYGRKQIIVIHDLAWFNDKEKYTVFKRFALKSFTKLLLKNAYKIITVSEWSKTDIKRTLNFDVNYVIPNTLTAELKPDSSFISNSFIHSYPNLIFEKYVLSIGTIQNGKNYINSSKIFESTLGKRGFKYIIVGDYMEDAKIVKKIKSKYKNTIFTGYLKDEYMFHLLKNCAGYVNLSYYEGFGIPLLDAILYFKPALISDNSAMVDLALTSHVKVNPFDEEAIKIGFTNFTNAVIDKNETESLLIKYSQNNVRQLISDFFDDLK